MLERSLEIVCVNAPERIFGSEWKVIAQQLTVPSGRLDILLSDSKGTMCVVELKKGAANTDALNQVQRYQNDLRLSFPENNVTSCVLAHSVPSETACKASEMGVNCIELSLAEIDQIRLEFNLDDALLIGTRKIKGIISGGQARKATNSTLSNEEAFSEMPECLKILMGGLEQTANFRIYSMKMQTIILYHEIKIGGINRKHRGGCAYIAIGVVNSESFVTNLNALGFREMNDGRNHYWYETKWDNCEKIQSALLLATLTIDRAFNLR